MKLPLVVVACLGLFTSGAFAARPGAADELSDSLDGAKPFTHVAFVVDTSPAMRDPRTRKLWPMVAQSVTNVLATHPEIKFVQLIDCAGRQLLGSRDQWMRCDRDGVDQLMHTLERATGDGVANPVTGIQKALTLPISEGLNDQIHVCVIGNQFNEEHPEVALRALERANPSDGYGGRRATISAVQLPTPLRPGGEAKTPGEKFETLMKEVAQRHGGTYRLLAGVDRP